MSTQDQSRFGNSSQVFDTTYDRSVLANTRDDAFDFFDFQNVQMNAE